MLCIDDQDYKCDVTKATTCYWAEAQVHGVNVLVPQDLKPYPGDVCRTQTEFPEESVCVHYYGACTEHDKELFHEKETGYAQLRSLLLNKTMCEGVKKLSTCIHNETMKNCAAKFANTFTVQNAKQNEVAARNLSHCLEGALKPCSPVRVGDFIEYLQNVAAAVEHLYKHKEQPVPPTEPATTPSSTTVKPSTSTVLPTTTTQEPVTTHEPVPTTPEPVPTTTHEPVTATTGVPPTTQGPPGAASTAQAVGAFGVVALAWLVRAA